MKNLNITTPVVLAIGLISVMGNPAIAQTKREAQIFVENKTGKEIEIVTVIHKYSDVYKNSMTWVELPNQVATKFPIKCEYNTGAFTTGKDWWLVTFKFKGNDDIYATSPNNLRSGFDAVEGAFLKFDVVQRYATVMGTCLGATAGAVAGTAIAPGPGTAVMGATFGAIGNQAGNAAGKELQKALMNGEKTEGFKQHILRKEDENKPTYIKIYLSAVTFESPSGKSETIWKKVSQVKSK